MKVLGYVSGLAAILGIATYFAMNPLTLVVLDEEEGKIFVEALGKIKDAKELTEATPMISELRVSAGARKSGRFELETSFNGKLYRDEDTTDGSDQNKLSFRIHVTPQVPTTDCGTQEVVLDLRLPKHPLNSGIVELTDLKVVASHSQGLALLHTRNSVSIEDQPLRFTPSEIICLRGEPNTE